MSAVSGLQITTLTVVIAFACVPKSGSANDSNPENRIAVENESVESGLVSEHGDFRILRVVGKLEQPWAVAWLPDGRKLISERKGNLLLIENNHVINLEGLPNIHEESEGQGGLLDVAVHPDYSENGWIYFTYSSPGDPDGIPDEEYGTATALARAKLGSNERELTDLETLYVASPRYEPGRHYGSRIVFPGDGTVIFSVGDRGMRRPAQDLTDPSGSMIRLNEDGGAYEDNPFVGEGPGNLRPEIYSFGHRNNQGLALNPKTGELWTTEHGPYGGGDMLHKVVAGQNYGWPQVAFGTEYETQEQVGVGESAPGVQKPVYVWEDTMAPSGLAFYNGDAFPAWQGDLLAGSLYQEALYRLELENDEVNQKEKLINGEIGRIRDVRVGPDGFVYLLTDESEAGLYRLEPVQ